MYFTRFEQKPDMNSLPKGENLKTGKYDNSLIVFFREEREKPLSSSEERGFSH